MVVNSAIAVGFFPGQLEYFRGKGFDVTVLCPERREDEWVVEVPEGISVIRIPMERKIAPLRDLLCLWRLCSLIRALRPAVTNVGTPKAGLLGGLAAWINRVPCRFYTLHGLRFETTCGLKHKFLVYVERLASRLAHRVVVVSPSVRKKAIACRLASQDRAAVLGSGSCNGIDAARFAATPQLMRRAAQLRRQLGISLQAPVVLFVGRLTRDKGIPELVKAFSSLAVQFPKLRLLLVGCFEEGDPLPSDTRRRLETHPQIIFAGPVADPVPYYATADILVLPSHREGLPTVVLEAFAAGLPVVAASATGIVDIVAHGETGLLFPIGDARALASAIAKLLNDAALATRLSHAGQEHVKCNFQQERIWNALHHQYLEVLRKNRPTSLFLLREHGNLAVESSG